MKFRPQVESLGERVVPDATQLALLNLPTDAAMSVPSVTLAINPVAQDSTAPGGAVPYINPITPTTGTSTELLVSTMVAGPDSVRARFDALRREAAGYDAQLTALQNTRVQQVGAYNASVDAFNAVAALYDARLDQLKKAGWTNAQINNDPGLAAYNAAMVAINTQVVANKAAIATTDAKIATVTTNLGECTLEMMNMIVQYPYLYTGDQGKSIKLFTEVSSL